MRLTVDVLITMMVVPSIIYRKILVVTVVRNRISMVILNNPSEIFTFIPAYMDHAVTKSVPSIFRDMVDTVAYPLFLDLRICTTIILVFLKMRTKQW